MKEVIYENKCLQLCSPNTMSKFTWDTKANTEETNDTKFIISGYASVFGAVDSYRDVVLQGAFANAVQKFQSLKDTKHTSNSVKLLWQHDQSNPIGTIFNMYEDNYGLFIEAEIIPTISKGKEAIELITRKVINGLSIGFTISKYDYSETGERIIRQVDLWEISVVTFPANSLATISLTNNMEVFMNGTSTDLEVKGIADISSAISHDMKEMKSQLDQLKTAINRPDMTTYSRNSRDSLVFDNFVRNGSTTECTLQPLEQKSFSATSDVNGSVIVTAEKYHNIIGALSVHSPMRRLASVETISTGALDVVLSGGLFNTGWVAETAERADTDNPELIQKRIPVHELYAQPKATQRLLDDTFVNVESWLISSLVESFAAIESRSFIHGDGTNKPTGILHYDEIQSIDSEQNRVISPIDLLNLINSLNEAYLSNATFLMNRRTLSDIQRIQDLNGRFIWQSSPSEAFADTIWGIPVVCCNDMPSIGDRGGAVIALADFKRAYKIVDRKDIHIMKDPYTNKPFVKFYATKRVGGDVVDMSAIKLLKIAA